MKRLVWRNFLAGMRRQLGDFAAVFVRIRRRNWREKMALLGAALLALALALLYAVFLSRLSPPIFVLALATEFSLIAVVLKKSRKATGAKRSSNKLDQAERYRQIIRATLAPLTERRYANADVTNAAVFDEAHDHYLVVSAGWEGKTRRIYHSLVHLDIIEGKVWIQRDGTGDGIGYELEAAGIPKSDIVPAFYPESVRPHTGYAVA